MEHIYYIHGFGGRNSTSAFGQRMNQFINRYSLDLNLITYAWDSLPIDFLKLVHNFMASREAARAEGLHLLDQITEHERLGELYHLVGFSLGGEVIRCCLQAAGKPLQHLRSVYLVGGAIDHDADLRAERIPPGTRCHNYYSPGIDLALGFSYVNATGTPAAGAIGLTQNDRFENLRVRCTHASFYNYTGIAPAIAALIAWDAGQRIPGNANTNWALATSGGDTHWHQICNHNGHRVQMNIHSGHYRALDAQNIRVAWGRNLHAVLRTVDACR